MHSDHFGLLAKVPRTPSSCTGMSYELINVHTITSLSHPDKHCKSANVSSSDASYSTSSTLHEKDGQLRRSTTTATPTTTTTTTTTTTATTSSTASTPHPPSSNHVSPSASLEILDFHGFDFFPSTPYKACLIALVPRLPFTLQLDHSVV